MILRRIIQKCTTDCGIACAAMVAGVPYKQAFDAAIGSEIIGRTQSSSLRKLLLRLGVASRKGHRQIHWSSIPSLAIAGVNYKEKDATWHWVVFVPDTQGGYVLDPNGRIKAYRRTDFQQHLTPWCAIPIQLDCAFKLGPGSRLRSLIEPRGQN